MLRTQLSDLFNPHVAGHELFHEYHSNESADPSKVLFHALGAWRIKSAFHDLLWHPQFTVPAGQLLGDRCDSGMINCFANLPNMAVSWRGIKTIPTGTEPFQ